MSAGLQITGWPAHDSSVSSILFGPDETSIFSLGSDGKVSLINIPFSLKMKRLFCILTEFFFVRYLNGVCKIKVKYCGQETAVGMVLN